MKDKKIIALVIILLLLAFYWFEVRPTNIKKKCHKESLDESVMTYPETSWPNLKERETLQQLAYKYNYETCLLEHGID